MIKLTVLGSASIILVAALAAWKKLPSRIWLIGGAVGACHALPVPFFFGVANLLLAGGTLSAVDISAELAKWRQMRWFRTVACALGLFCAVRAKYVRSGNA